LIQWARRPLVACILLLAIYVALSFANDPHGYLGTDTGGKVATLRSMQVRHDLRPDVGYWAARWDPQGRLHPLSLTVRQGKQWLNVTTLPVLYLALPLYRVGGYRLILLLPMLGAVAVALAARRLALVFGADRPFAELAFWIIGLASPVVVYANDFWEHTIGMALVAWGLVVLLEVVEGRRPAAFALVAGACFGAAATMRTEAYVYGASITAVCCLVVLWRSRRLLRPVLIGAAVVVGLGVPLLANAGLEQAAVHAQLRSSRTVSQAGRGPEQNLTVRAREAGLTSVGLHPSEEWAAVGLGLALLALLLVAASCGTRAGGDLTMAAVALLGASLLYLIRFRQHLGYVPGAVAACPVVAVGLLRGWTSSASARLAVAAMLLALPAVWLFQFTGGAEPQWGGRYVLPTTLVLAVAGVVAMPSLRRAVAIALLALSVAVSAFGLRWLEERSHDVASAAAELTRGNGALVFRVGHVAREMGGFYTPERRWLTALSRADEARAAGVMARAGVRKFSVVSLEQRQGDSRLEGFTVVGRRHIDLFHDTPLRVTTYRASA
jgi:hypothetical protein